MSVAALPFDPDLKANERSGQLQSELSDTENKLAYARNDYNGADMDV